MPPGPLTLEIDRSDASAPRLVIAGEIDLATAPALEEAAAALLDERPRTLVLDFSGVPFCDSSGIGVLVRLYNRTTVTGSRLTVRNPSENVRVVLHMTSLTRILRIEE
jgi:anti-sigma B factor antagonist